MNAVPVITRELRQQARQRYTYWLRTIGVLALLSAAFLLVFDERLATSNGVDLFRSLHLGLYCAIWILVPLGAADCISRERREGTLGLLFLTPLKPGAIVIAKGIAHGLRSTTLVVAVLPVLTIPILAGGVTWEMATLSALIQFSSICWALAATLVASAFCKKGLQALVLAVVLMTGATFIYAVFIGEMVMSALSGFFGARGSVHTLELGFSVVSMNVGSRLMTTVGSLQFILIVSKIAGVSALVLLSSIVLAALRIRRNWREEPAPAWVQKTQRVFLTPVVLKGFFRSWLRWQLERNPLGWLERRHWMGRLVTWSWFAIMACVLSFALTESNLFSRRDTSMQSTLGWLLAGSIAATVAGSFRRERESGVLELLLVTPMTTPQIIIGRLRGVWGQFLPAVMVLFVVWGYMQNLYPYRNDSAEKMLYFAVTFLTLPVIGLYFSLRCRSYLAAFLSTLLFAVVLPHVLAAVARFYSTMFLSDRYAHFDISRSDLFVSAMQILIAARLFVSLYRRLDRRDFPMEHTA